MNVPKITPEKEPLTWKIWKKKRYVVVVMVFFGMIANYSIRTLLSVAIVEMTNEKLIDYGNGTIAIEQEFTWNSKEQGIILSALFYGYTCIMLIAGYLATRFGGVLVYGGGLVLASIFTFVTPFFASYGFAAIITLRVLAGLSEGASFISVYAVYNQWIPPNERSFMMSLGVMGIQTGTVAGMLLSGVLAKNLGWRSIFYAFGGYGIVWYIIWLIIVRENPSKDKYISEDEKRYINESLDNMSTVKHPIPYKSIVKSIPVYAYCIASFAELWGFFTLMTCLPTFIKDTLDVDVQGSGILAAAPYICMIILLPISGRIADFLRAKNYLTTSQVRRYYTFSSFISQAIFLQLSGHIMDSVWVMVFMVISVGFGAFAFNGYYVVPLEIAPKFSSALTGFTHTIASTTGIISPIITGWIVQNKDVNEWRNVFYITSGVFVFGAVIFLVFGSAEEQQWAKVDNVQKEQNSNMSNTVPVHVQ